MIVCPSPRPHDIRVGGAIRLRFAAAARRFTRPQRALPATARRRRDRVTRAQHQHGVATGEIEGQRARRGEVLGAVEAARRFVAIQEIPVPRRRMHVARRSYSAATAGRSGVRFPRDVAAGCRGAKSKARILVHQRVVVAAGKQRTHGSAARAPAPAMRHVSTTAASPRSTKIRARSRPSPTRNVQCGQGSARTRPGCRRRADRRHVRRVVLCRQGNASRPASRPRLQPVDQHHATGGRRRAVSSNA